MTNTHDGAATGHSGAVQPTRPADAEASVNVTISMKQYELDRIKMLARWNGMKYQPYLKQLLRVGVRKAEADMEEEKQQGGYSAVQTYDHAIKDYRFTVRHKGRVIAEGGTYDETYEALSKLGLSHYQIIPTLVEADNPKPR